MALCTSSPVMIGNHDISKNVWSILMKFDMVMHLGPPDPSANKIWEFLKSKMAAVAIEKSKNRDIPATDWRILTKYGTIMHLSSLRTLLANEIWRSFLHKVSRIVHCSLYKKAQPKNTEAPHTDNPDVGIQFAQGCYSKYAIQYNLTSLGVPLCSPIVPNATMPVSPITLHTMCLMPQPRVHFSKIAVIT